MSTLVDAESEDFDRIWSKVITSLPDWMAGLERELRDIHLARRGVTGRRNALSHNAVAAITALYREYSGDTVQNGKKKRPALT